MFLCDYIFINCRMKPALQQSFLSWNLWLPNFPNQTTRRAQFCYIIWKGKTIRDHYRLYNLFFLYFSPKYCTMFFLFIEFPITRSSTRWRHSTWVSFLDQIFFVPGQCFDVKVKNFNVCCYVLWNEVTIIPVFLFYSKWETRIYRNRSF